MNVGYGCKIYLHAHARMCLKRSLLYSLSQKWSRSLFLLGAIIISIAPPFLLVNKVLQLSRCQSVSRILILIISPFTTLGCNTSAVSVVCHVVLCPRTKYFSLPKSCICHVVSNHWFECSVFLIHSAWTFASSVLVCNNQMFLYGVVVRWLPCDLFVHFNERVWLDWMRG